MGTGRLLWAQLPHLLLEGQALQSWPSWWPLTELNPIYSLLSSTGRHKHGWSIPDVVWPVLSQKGPVTSLDLLAMLLSVQPRMLLAPLLPGSHWLTFSLLPTRAPRTFSADLLPRQSGPSRPRCQGFFLPRCRTLHLPLLNFIRFLLDHSSSLSRSLWMVVPYLSVLFLPPSLMSSVKLMSVLCHLLLVNDENVLRNRSHDSALWYSTIYSPPGRVQLPPEPNHPTTICWVKSSKHFLCTYPDCNVSIWVQEYCVR